MIDANNLTDAIQKRICNSILCLDKEKKCELCPISIIYQTIDLLDKDSQEEKRLKGEWIPVSERLPDNRDWCLGLFKEPDTDFIGIPYVCDYVGEVTKGTTNEGWILRHCTDVDTASDYFRNLICIAWQPLPEPYKKGSAE